MNEQLSLGIDIGSVSVKLSLLDKNGNVLFHSYTRSLGQPIKVFLKMLEELSTKTNLLAVSQAGVTGSGGRPISLALKAPFYNEILTQYKATEKIYPAARSIVDIGGEDSKLILLEKHSKTGLISIKDFAMNTICAAGTGSFLDQQAERLGVSIEKEFGKLALKSKEPPRIAGRCSVFAKTDMIHLQQEATPDHDIVAGLCFALTRSFKNTVAKGKKFSKPLSFQGGVAANQGMVRALRETLGLANGELFIPRYYNCMGAIGAALLASEEKNQNWQLQNIAEIKKNLASLDKKIDWLDGLIRNKKETPKIKIQTNSKAIPKAHRAKEGFLGIDVGSISTNLVVIDSKGNVLAKKYLMTAGRPLRAVQTGLCEIYSQLNQEIKICGVGTTGSGRYLIGDFVGADQIKNEITAQATAACHFNPSVDTIFEIGGQDSKYISLENGTVTDFRMNKVCAAGTGSFLEEQAQRLGINIKNEFGEKAFSSNRACSLGERCTVFMESNLVRAQQQGVEVSELTAGLSYSIAANYLNRVVEDRKVGEVIFFQGGVAYNQGVIAAFEKILNKKIIIPPNHEVTGAIGAAILAQKNNGKTNFRGFLTAANSQYKLSSFECRDCPNHCKVRMVKLDNGSLFYYGNRCEKYEINKKNKISRKPLDLFQERESRLLTPYQQYHGRQTKNDLKIGIPLCMTSHELLPLWSVFFGELGIEIILSDKTNKDTIHAGIEKVGSETCFPVKVAHGHVANLIKKGVNAVFIPTLLNMPNYRSQAKESCNCPYVQTLSHLVKSVIDFDSKGIKLLNPEITLGWERKINIKTLINFALSLDAGRKRAKLATLEALKAQDSFYRQNMQRGKEILSQLNNETMVAVIAARSYNGCDQGINLNLPSKLREMGVMPLPLDYLPLPEAGLKNENGMYWSHGQKILAAAKIISQTKNLLPVYATNFGCGPDSFITHFFEEAIKGRPYLQLEFDEHSSDVGVITRCEAFTDSVKNWQKRNREKNISKNNHSLQKEGNLRPAKKQSKKHYKIYVPRLGDHAFVLAAAMRRSGYQAEVFPESNQETLFWGRKFTSGKECYPCIVTTGDMVRITKQKSFNPSSSAFFMPSTNGPCRFGQYSKLQRLVLNNLGLKEVPIVSPNQANNLEEEMSFIGKVGYKETWQAILAVDSLYKLKHKIRPYEKNKGITDKVYQQCLSLVCEAVEEGRPVFNTLSRIKEKFTEIETNNQPQRPLIGIVGEIYVRSNSFCNKNIIKQIESLGAEVWISPISEWLFHVTKTFHQHSKTKEKYFQQLKAFFAQKLQEKYEHKISAPLKKILSDRQEPNIAAIWKNCGQHLPPWFGEAALGVGKVKDLFEKGASGIIGLMPFTCLPGNIFSSILNALKKDCRDLPTLIVNYDSSGETDVTNQLEAFIYQAKQNQSRQNSS